MDLLRVTDLVYRPPDRPEPLLRGASLVLRAGERVGLVGRNGAGKSTLLKLLVGKLTPLEGRVVRAPGLRAAYLPQGGGELRGTVWENAAGGLEYLRSLEAEMRAEEARLSRGEDRLESYGELSELFARAGGYEAEAALRATLGRLGFDEEDYGRSAASLSGGERARLALARVLAQRPDLLLLDEPSNFLDLPTRRWLGVTLANYPAALLLASHDRALLDAVCSHTVHLSEGHLTRYRGAYSRFRAQVEHASVSFARQARRGAQERARLAAQVAAQPTATRRRTLLRRLERLEASANTPVTRAPTRAQGPLELGAGPPRKTQPLLDARHLSAQKGGRTVVADAFLRVYAGEKIALVGPNGSGKTTLLQLLAGREASAHPQAERHYASGARLAMFDQHTRGLEDETPVGVQLARYVSELRARSLLASVDLGGAWDTLAENLSGGERARAGLALVMASEANVLLLDEPSEQLGAEMLERLETALADTEAAVVLVSHDAALVGGVAERVLSLEVGELREYRGGLAGYFAGTLRLEPDLPELPANTEPEADREIDLTTNLETRLEALEDETAALEAQLADPTRLAEREESRLKSRLRDLIGARSELYDARLPPPRPAYEVLRGGILVSTEGRGQPLVIESSAGLSLRLFRDGMAGHLAPVTLEGGGSDRCVLPWARLTVLRATVELAFEHLGVRALQLQTHDDLKASGFQPASDGWWLLDRNRYEREEGYLRGPPPRAVGAKNVGTKNVRVKKKLVFHPDYTSWARRNRRKK